jgi:hypothetical protein
MTISWEQDIYFSKQVQNYSTEENACARFYFPQGFIREPRQNRLLYSRQNNEQ